MNLWGVLRLDDVDPALCRGRKVAERDCDAQSVIVVGAGGSEIWRRMHDESGIARGLPARVAARSFDAWSRRVLEREVEMLQRAGFSAKAIFPFDPDPVCFQQMAEAAGLVVASPVVGLLLHPEFGPNVSMRGAIVVKEELEASGELEFDPCSACAAPCLEACPVGAYPEPGRAQPERCAAQRHSGGCADSCSVRRACPRGAEHRLDPDHEFALQAAPIPAMRREHGLVWWRFVPEFLRRRRSVR